MKKALRWLTILLAAVVLLTAVAALVLWRMASRLDLARELAALSSRAGVPVTAAKAVFDFGSLARLEPSLTFEDLRVANPPGFESPHLLAARRVFAHIALRPLLHKRVEILALNLDQPEFTLERNRQGVSNLETLLQKLTGSAESGSSAPGSGMSTHIRRLEVRNGSARILEAGARGASRAGRASGINLEVLDLAPGKALPVRLAAKLYQGFSSNLRFEGTIGPSAADSLPAEGKLRLGVAVADLPENTRRQAFGSLLSVPGRSAVSVDADLKGDAYQLLTASGRFRLTEMQVGKDASHLLALAGESPMRVTITKPLSTPVVDLKLRDGQFRLGAGQWRGDVDAVSVGGVLRLRSKGAISNVDVDQFLGAFTSSTNKVEGMLTIPSYELRLGGRDAQAMRSSLNGHAKIEIAKGRLKALDLLATVRRALEGERTDPTGRQGDTEFTTLATNLAVEGQQLDFTNLALDGPAIQGTGHGVIVSGNAIRFHLDTPIRGRLGELIPKSVGRVLPFDISGTVARPIVVPDLKRIVVETTRGVIEDILKRKVEPKLKLPMSLPDLFKKREPKQ